MKKSTIIFLLIGIVLFSSFASAQIASAGELVKKVVQSLQEIFTPIFDALIGDGAVGKPFFFMKILLLFLLFAVIYSVLGRIDMFKTHRGVTFIVTAVVSLIGVRYISEESFIAGILLPYGALAISLVTLLPLLMYFWAVYDSGMGPMGRKIAWVIYAVVFCAVWYTRQEGQQISGTSEWIYILGILAVAICLIADRQIKGAFTKSKSKTRNASHVKALINKKKVDRMNALLAGDDVSEIKKLDAEIADLERLL